MGAVMKIPVTLYVSDPDIAQWTVYLKQVGALDSLLVILLADELRKKKAEWERRQSDITPSADVLGF